MGRDVFSMGMGIIVREMTYFVNIPSPLALIAIRSLWCDINLQLLCTFAQSQDQSR